MRGWGDHPAQAVKVIQCELDECAPNRLAWLHSLG